MIYEDQIRAGPLVGKLLATVGFSFVGELVSAGFPRHRSEHKLQKQEKGHEGDKKREGEFPA